MQPEQHSITTEAGENVPSSCKHIDISICSHEVGTSDINIKTAYCKDNIQILQDINGSYHHKGIEFTIVDGWFLSKEVNFELPRRTKINTFQRVALSIGIPLSKQDPESKLDITKVRPKNLLYALTMMALKDLKIISNQFSHRKQLTYGKNVFEAYLRAVSGSGRIKASEKNIRWLNEQDTLQLKSKLFSTSGYVPGVHSMKYEPTELAEDIMKSVYSFFKLLDFKENEVHHQVLDFTVTVDDFEQIRLRDVMLLLSYCVGYDGTGFIIRPELEDRQYSRVYSVFTSISSKTRKLLGFYNYDIGAALQTICLQLVKDPDLYPLHQELVNDKKAFRAKVQIETGKDADWVKKELSKIDNLENMPMRYEQYPTLKSYFSESLLLRKEIISSAEPLVLARAKEFANPVWMKFWNPVKNKYELILTEEKKESGIFFFVWTQWERLIRESMMSCFDNPSACHQVHDAVYSRQKIDPVLIEKKVLEDTGFVVQISTD